MLSISLLNLHFCDASKTKSDQLQHHVVSTHSKKRKTLLFFSVSCPVIFSLFLHVISKLTISFSHSTCVVDLRTFSSRILSFLFFFLW